MPRALLEHVQNNVLPKKTDVIERSYLEFTPSGVIPLESAEKAICQGKLYPIQDIHSYHFIWNQERTGRISFYATLDLCSAFLAEIHRGDQIHSHSVLLD